MNFLKPTAPEFEDIIGWINTIPLTIKKLKGKVVLLDFWTYSCVNCIRTLLHMKELWKKYKDKNFVLIGVHTPEFDFERKPENVEKAVKKHGIKYPVALDSNNTTWRLYGNSYWPRQTLIDKNGKVVYEHIGEGGYVEIEDKIRNFVRETGIKLPDKETKNDELKLKSFHTTPETYLGHLRNEGFGNSSVCVPDSCIRFVDQGDHQLNIIYLDGDWMQKAEFIKHEGKKGHVSLKYTAKEVNTVMAPFSKKFEVEVQLDGKSLTKSNAGKDVIVKNGKSYVAVDKPDMFNLVETKKQEIHELKIITTSKDFTMYAFTFG